MMIRGILTVLVCLLTFAQANAQASPINADNCLNLTTDSRFVTLEQVRAVSELPLPAAPLLQLKIKLQDLDQLADNRLCLKVAGYRLISSGQSASSHCELMVVGTEQNGTYSPIYRIERQQSSVTLPLYAFCRTINLPGTVGQNLPFPSSDTVLDVGSFESPPDTDAERFALLDSIVQRATTNACTFSDGTPITLKSLAVQFAVFIANAPTSQRNEIWRAFLEQANNTFYRDERNAIYCLLEDVGISVPDATFTPTPTPTHTPGASPTPTPINTPTPTLPAFMDAVIPEGTLGGTTLRDAFLGITLTVFAFAGVLILALLLLAVIKGRSRTNLVALLFVSFVLGDTLQAQPTPDSQNPHPPLMLMVLLDDSRTMDGLSNNTATTTRKLTGGRNASDPQAIRYAALESLLRQLQADSLTAHQVSVLSYATTDKAKWLSGSDDASRFVTLGGGVDSTALDELLAAIYAPRSEYDYPKGPGDTAKAFTQTALPILQTRLEAPDARQFRPVMLLITDDVPIARFTDSPWNLETPQQAIEKWRAEGLAAFESQLDSLVKQVQYDSVCRSGSGGLSLVTVSMGAANWVRYDGILRTQSELEVQPDIATADEYFTTLAQNLGSVWEDGSPMVYRIDATFRSEQDVVDDFALPTQELIGRLRCLWPSDTPTIDSSAPLNSVRYTFPVSEFYRQLWMMVSAPSSAGIPQLTTIDGTSIPVTFERSVGGYRAALLRDNAVPNPWGGTWQITIPQAQADQVSVRLYAQLDFNGVSARITSQTANLTPSKDTELIIQLLKDGQPLRDTVFINTMQANLSSSGRVSLTSSTSDPSVFSGSITADSVAQTGNIEVNLTLTLHGKSGVTVPSELSVVGSPPLNLTFSSGFDFGEPEEPPNNIIWDGDCYVSDTPSTPPEVTVKLPFSIGASQLDIESVGSYARVEVYYGEQPATVGLATATPIAVLAFDRDSRNAFAGAIPCRILQPGNDQQIVIRAMFPDGKVKNSSIVFHLSTLTPTPSPTATTTAQNTPTQQPSVTPTLTPPNADIGQDIGATLTSPLVLTALLIVAAGLLIGFVIWGGMAIFSIVLPLRHIQVYLNDSEEALSLGWRSHNVTLDNQAIFRLKVAQDSRSIIITPKVEGLRINGSLLSREIDTIRDERQIVVQYDNNRWFIINKRG